MSVLLRALALIMTYETYNDQPTTEKAKLQLKCNKNKTLIAMYSSTFPGQPTSLKH